jgi:hypothetical protein
MGQRVNPPKRPLPILAGLLATVSWRDGLGDSFLGQLRLGLKRTSLVSTMRRLGIVRPKPSAGHGELRSR